MEKKKASEFFNKKKKKNQVSILQWVWNTQLWQFSLLLYTAFICTALLLPRPASDWKVKVLSLPLRPDNPWELKLPMPLFNIGLPSPAMPGALPRGRGTRRGPVQGWGLSSAASASAGGTRGLAAEEMPG